MVVVGPGGIGDRVIPVPSPNFAPYPVFPGLVKEVNKFERNLLYFNRWRNGSANFCTSETWTFLVCAQG